MSLKLFVAKIIALTAAGLLPSRIMKRKEFFRIWEKRGYHVTPVHYHESIPDTAALKEELWSKHSELVGIDIREKEQMDLLGLFFSQFGNEYNAFPAKKAAVPYGYYVNNAAYESVDGEVLYCMVRHFKPRTIFEIGSGHSTYCAAEAVLKNKADDGRECDLEAFEPYPNPVLEKGFPGLSRLHKIKIQDIPLADFGALRENDILFIDSSHVLNIGSDVQYEFLEILPRLNKGVIIHVHDIFLPAEYPRAWTLELNRFWTEQYLLQAFLAFNGSFEVLWASQFMHLRHPDKLESAFRSYRRSERQPGSFWMRKIK